MVSPSSNDLVNSLCFGLTFSTLLVSIGPLFTQYYFICFVIVVVATILTLEYIAWNRRKEKAGESKFFRSSMSINDDRNKTFNKDKRKESRNKQDPSKPSYSKEHKKLFTKEKNLSRTKHRQSSTDDEPCVHSNDIPRVTTTMANFTNVAMRSKQIRFDRRNNDESRQEKEKKRMHRHSALVSRLQKWTEDEVDVTSTSSEQRMKLGMPGLSISMMHLNELHKKVTPTTKEVLI